MNEKRVLGNLGEDAALAYFKKRGYALCARNYRAERCEIDLILREGACTVFVEVKARSSGRYGLGREAVTAAKQNNILRAAKHYLMENVLFEAPVRFDVAEFDPATGHIEHIKNAFGE
ncbi:MAG: YraN family protein [Eubacteriales bacterium]|nr:YraN family protein [Eubacteriales bacterium]